MPSPLAVDFDEVWDIYGTSADLIGTNQPGWLDQSDTNPRCGIRFELGETIPLGATIDSCTITFDYNWNNGSGDIDCRFEDDGNPSAWTNYSDINGRPVTTAIVAWSIGTWSSGTKTTPELKTIIQEIVDVEAISTLHFLGEQQGSATVKFDTGFSPPTGAKPTLDISWTVSAGSSGYASKIGGKLVEGKIGR